MLRRKIPLHLPRITQVEDFLAEDVGFLRDDEDFLPGEEFELLTEERDSRASGVADLRADGPAPLAFDEVVIDFAFGEVFLSADSLEPVDFDFEAEDFFAEGLFFLSGTFAPDSRASLMAMATACSRLFTFPPFPSLPDSNSPCLYSCMTSLILSCAFFEYLAITFVFCKERELRCAVYCRNRCEACRCYGSSTNTNGCE